MSEHHEFSERLIDLCVDHALGVESDDELNELSENERQQLDALDPHAEAREAFEAAAARIDLAYAEAHPVQMPDGFMERLQATMADKNPNPAPSPALNLAPEPQLTPRVAGRLNWLPWTLAAASLLLAAGVLLTTLPSAPPEMLSPAQARAQLLQEADPDDLVRLTWTATEDPAVVDQVTGDIVWSDARQEGYMRISGLAVNDPQRAQYQLWMFDATRPTGDLPQLGEGLLSQRPVDGGVFNVSSTGEVIIPINAKLPVRQGVAFAVTVEPPGGVVVSDRSRVPLLALPSQG